MTISFIYIFSLIKLCLCCEDTTKISFLSPFNDLTSIRSKPTEDIVIVCCHPDGANQLRWENKDGKQIPYNTAGTFSLIDEKNRLILRINNIDNSNVGLYSCINKQKGLSKSISISLKLQYGISTTTKVEKYFPAGKSISIECPLENRQSFKAWIVSFGGKNFRYASKIKGTNFEIGENPLNFIVLNTISEKSIKMLWCQYQEVNLDGDVFDGMYEITWTLYEPININIAIENKEPILESQNVQLICTFNVFERQSVNFPNNIFKQHYNVRVESGKRILTIPKITKDLEGEYECKVTNFLSVIPFKTVDESAKIKIEVVIPPKISRNSTTKFSAEIKEMAYLRCEITSTRLLQNDAIFEKYVTLNSEWVKLNDKEDRYTISLEEKDKKYMLTLMIKNVKWDDRGQYRCSVLNAAGKDFMIVSLLVKKTAELFTKNKIIEMSMEPVEVDCSLAGFPLSDDDTIEFRILNQTSDVKQKFIKKDYTEMDGFKYKYEVSYVKKLTEGQVYFLECFYLHKKTMLKQSIMMELRTPIKPAIPNVSIICTGSSGVVFKYEIPPVISISKNVKKNELFYGPSKEFEKIIKKSSNIIPINNEDPNKFYIYVLKYLRSNRNYTFQWESYNSFQISSSLILFAKTKPLSPPQKPKSIEFSTKVNKINVILNLVDDCPYKGANSAIRDVVVRMKPINNQNPKNIQHWSWTETNITVDVENSKLQFLIFLEKPQLDYEIEVALRSKQGSSEFIKSEYKADVVLAGSLFTCFPRCTSQTLLSNLFVLQTLLAFLIYFRMI